MLVFAGAVVFQNTQQTVHGGQMHRDGATTMLGGQGLEGIKELLGRRQRAPEDHVVALDDVGTPLRSMGRQAPIGRHDDVVLEGQALLKLTGEDVEAGAGDGEVDGHQALDALQEQLFEPGVVGSMKRHKLSEGVCHEGTVRRSSTTWCFFVQTLGVSPSS